MEMGVLKTMMQASSRMVASFTSVAQKKNVLKASMERVLRARQAVRCGATAALARFRRCSTVPVIDCPRMRKGALEGLAVANERVSNRGSDHQHWATVNHSDALTMP